jgi:hypothetical protein
MMLKSKNVFLYSFVLVCLGLISLASQVADPWTQDQLLEPADLARSINDAHAPQFLVFSVGPGAVIKGSTDIGPAHEKENLAKLRAQLKALPKDAHVVVYCGCCPFAKCPNVRPAFNLLKEMKFKNGKLLNLATNVKTDWIDHGYPVAE